MLRILAEAITNGDLSIVDVVLQSAVLGMADYHDAGSYIITYLYRSGKFTPRPRSITFNDYFEALSPSQDILSNLAFEALLSIWGSSNSTVPELSFDTILYALRSLGADSAVTEKLGWVAHNAPCDISDSQREICIDRLVHCIRTATEQAFPSRYSPH